jgi:NTP pyrophosphatase (non-canonical NTP hydrolase)
MEENRRERFLGRLGPPGSGKTLREKGGLTLVARAGFLIPNGNDNRSHGPNPALLLAAHGDMGASAAELMLDGRGHRSGVQGAYCSRRAKNDLLCAGRDCAGVFRWHRPAMSALTDSATTIAELKTRLLAFVRERDWEQFHSPKNLSMALAAESGELMEHFLWATPEQSRAIAADATKRGRIADELADVVIYALEFANITGLDVAAAIEAKMATNAKKYPIEKAKGRADKYTEL